MPGEALQAGVAAAHFQALMQRLAADGAPGAGYEKLRVRLLALFRHYDPVDAERLADETLDRLARRLAEGVSIVDLRQYALGIARLVLQEAAKRAARQPMVPADELPLTAPQTSESAEQERVDAALTRCLAQMDPAAAQLIVDYYGGGDTAEALIPRRRRLAETLSLSPNALRNRALRLRAALEDCVRRRLGGGP